MISSFLKSRISTTFQQEKLFPKPFFSCICRSFSSIETTEEIEDKFRLNRCFPLLSRREADRAILKGRVTVNNKAAQMGQKLQPTDIIHLDGKLIEWVPHKENTLKPLSLGLDTSRNMYIKMWKPKGTTCTTDLDDRDNIFASTNILSKVIKHRLFPIGRLDKHTTGLILLTSDTRLVGNLLGAATKQEKVYQVKVHKNISDEHILALSQGVVITTAATNGKILTAKTLPCAVRRIDSSPLIESNVTQPMRYYTKFDKNTIEIRLTEGRNRQIRRMLEVLQYKVIALHRIRFCGIGLDGLKDPTDWCTLNKEEVGKIVKIAEFKEGKVSTLTQQDEEEQEEYGGEDEENEDGDEEDITSTSNDKMNSNVHNKNHNVNSNSKRAAGSGSNAAQMPAVSTSVGEPTTRTADASTEKVVKSGGRFRGSDVVIRSDVMARFRNSNITSTAASSVVPPGGKTTSTIPTEVLKPKSTGPIKPVKREEQAAVSAANNTASSTSITGGMEGSSERRSAVLSSWIGRARAVVKKI